MSGASAMIAEAEAHLQRDVIALLFSLLTRPQAQQAAQILEGLTAPEIMALFNATQPPDELKLTVILPYLVEGKLSEFPTKGNALMTILLGNLQQATLAAAGDAAKLKGHSYRSFTDGATHLLGGAQLAKPAIGSPEYYKLMGALIANAAGVISPQGVWAFLQMSPRTLGTGYLGGVPVKGALAAAPGPTGQISPSGGGADVSKAAAAASSIQPVDVK